jgi:hypothetical protein
MATRSIPRRKRLSVSTRNSNVRSRPTVQVLQMLHRECYGMNPSNSSNNNNLNGLVP